MTKLITHYECPECGSHDTVLDAYAEWDSDAQDWKLHSTYEEMRCTSCGHDTGFIEVGVN